MLKNDVSALGIIFPNTYDSIVPELTNVRLMASIPFASRYRLVDFMLSSMAYCDITNISLLVNKNYLSLMDHLGSGREWDLVRKNGGLHLFPPNVERTSTVYTGSVSALAGILEFLHDQKEKYVVMAHSNIAANFDFKALIQAHIASGADVTTVYHETEIPEGYINMGNEQAFYYSYGIEDGRVKRIYVNSKSEGVQNLGMNICVVERELLIDLINTAFVRGLRYWERDVLLNQLDKLNVQAYKFEGYVARISGIKSYFNENMKLLDDANIDALFSGNPIYTKIRDDNPTRYIAGAKVVNTMAADGCVIEGTVENSILFRGVKVRKGAVVKNCILMQDTVIEEGAVVENIITDKNVKITEAKEVKGAESYPVYISKFQVV
ncbi:MAG: glucose-1-phosphate adenylyltransferase subunit GlgD [Lachnospiraceae bacterium]|nr:glucose-1-phosphate adenylyltransferase subunit GlgD [Lachnospiraceae bacterium]